MGYIRFWTMLTMLIYWVKNIYIYKHRSSEDSNKEIGVEVDTEKLSTCSCLVTRIQDKIIT